MWNDAYSTQCITIWDFVEDTADVFKIWLTYGNSDLIPKCDALPASVLESSYSLEMFANCGFEARDYKYVSEYSSRYRGPGADNSVKTKKDPFKIAKPSLKEDQPDLFSGRCERFRQIINGLCNTCSVQASGSTNKDALFAKCGKMDWTPDEMLAETSEDVTIVPAAGLIGFFVGSGAVLAMFRRRASTSAEQPLLGAES